MVDFINGFFQDEEIAGIVERAGQKRRGRFEPLMNRVLYGREDTIEVEVVSGSPLVWYIELCRDIMIKKGIDASMIFVLDQSIEYSHPVGPNCQFRTIRFASGEKE